MIKFRFVEQKRERIRSGSLPILPKRRCLVLPNIKSAKKRVLIIKAKTLQNQMVKSSMKTAIRKYSAALASGDKELAAETYKTAVKKIDTAVAKGILHKNTAARKKSQFTKKLNALNA